MSYLLLGLGLVILLSGAHFFIEGSVSVAYRFKMPPLLIGLTLISFGTSAPETLISAVSSYNGQTDLALGNVFGSIITNTLLALGLASVIAPLKVQSNTLKKEIPLLLLSSLVALVFAQDIFLNHESANLISRSEGLALLGFFTIFLAYTVSLSKQKGEDSITHNLSQSNLVVSVLWILLGLSGLVFGTKLTVEYATLLAESFGVSATVLGLTIVAIGTSLPEITTSAMASFKGHTDIAVGNVVGANLFNGLWILGLSASLNPLPVSELSQTSILFSCLMTLCLLIFLLAGKSKILSRKEGLVLLSSYAGYMFYLIKTL